MNGEDLCLRCRHPDHAGGDCGALLGTFYGDDGSTEDDRCDCTDALALIRDARAFPVTDTTVPPPF